MHNSVKTPSESRPFRQDGLQQKLILKFGFVNEIHFVFWLDLTQFVRFPYSFVPLLVLLSWVAFWITGRF